MTFSIALLIYKAAPSLSEMENYEIIPSILILYFILDGIYAFVKSLSAITDCDPDR